MRIRRGGEEVQQAQLVDHRFNQLLPQLTSDPADLAQLFQAFSSTLPPLPCTPIAPTHPPTHHTSKKPSPVAPPSHSLIYKQVFE